MSDVTLTLTPPPIPDLSPSPQKATLLEQTCPSQSKLLLVFPALILTPIPTLTHHLESIV